jgi:ankyrin repeat protein
VDHPNQTKEMQDVIVGRALPAVQKGRTALHLAASNGQDEIVSYICAVPGINVNVQDQFGFTPLHLAAHSPDHDDQRVCVIKELLNVKNINPNLVRECITYGDTRENARLTALHLAVRCNFIEAVNLLLDWRPKQGNETISNIVGVRWFSGYATPLHLAIRGGNFVIIDALIRFINTNWPEAINLRDYQGRTALHIAVMHSNLLAVETLLNQKAPLQDDEKDQYGKTPFSIAMDNHDYRMVRRLQSYFERTNKSKAYAAANAILVGAALLATVTFTAWLTLPVVGDSQLFWVFNSLCFYFAISTFLAAATASMPTKGPPVGQAENAVITASFCLSFSIAFAVCAFATIGFALIPQNIKYRRDVISTTIFGGLLCLAFLIYFLRSLLGFSSEIFFYIDFKFNALWDRVITKPLMDTYLVKHARGWLKFYLGYIYD